MNNPSINFHVQAHQTDFRIPTELIKKNFKSIQKLIEKQKKQVYEDVAKIKKNPKLPATIKLEMIRKLIRGFDQYSKKLAQAIEKDREYRSRLLARIDNLKVLEECCLAEATAILSEAKEEEQLNGEGKTDDLVDPKPTEEILPSNDKFLDLHNPKLINWYRDQTNLLIVDYLIKSNIKKDRNIGISLLKNFAKTDPKFLKLIDYDLFENFNKVFVSIIVDHDLTQIISWFNENRAVLKKSGSNLEFEINYCKFLSLIEKGDINEAINFSKLNLSPYGNKENYVDNEVKNHELNWNRLKEIGGLLVYMAIKNTSNSTTTASTFSSSLIINSSRFKEYEKLLSDERWENLSQSFLTNFIKLYAISQNYPLFIYLSIGLSSLKTKSCYRNTENTIFRCGHEVQDLQNINTKDKKFRSPEYYYKILNKNNNCPVCSPELFEISQNLPHAQLITNIFNNPFKLPNGNIYPFDKLLIPSEKYLSEKNTLLRMGKVKDPLTSEIFMIDNCVRVYPA
ncbi:protein FYV10 [Suhomyces tanzawaensis NRRL Y-17324]|uniref:Protein FYV10 n=1 Tax=Suhomyces tanzawaensis NRRL Y-17324 TaxID=984487 RepID=A0A1E4SI87_9ASCO|nr:protein FYV10 [Suhomyces tanzawaensis NRRL Y-17324]ODV79228.1 protein FYV10 [Suhomyces tanzawaensis NRRL Y-17324]